MLQSYPRMPATVIAERIGWTRSIRVLSARVAELRPVYLPPDPASRTAYVAGEIAQCDLWFPPVQIPVGYGQTRKPTLLPVLTMICAYSRWLSAVLIPSRRSEDLFAGWWQLITALGAVPGALLSVPRNACASRIPCRCNSVWSPMPDCISTFGVCIAPRDSTTSDPAPTHWILPSW